ncbi:MAG: DivIVA domain-containing protein [Clostridia bacterium]|nr:DivIVA domain-containing protein [Clostridia bacterium]
MIPPHELKSVEFTRGIRGYNTQEVDDQIEYLLKSYTELYRHTAEMEKAYTELYRKYKEATADREAVKSDLIDARIAGDKIIEAAEEKAEMIIRATKTNCDYIINDYRRTVSEEREKLLKIQAQIQVFREKMIEECHDYIDRIEEMTEISDTTLYYSTDDELTARALDEIKTDVRYAMVGKEQLDTISDEDAKVDLDCFTEEKPDEPVPEATRTDVFKGSKVDLSETIQMPDNYSDLLNKLDENRG